MAREMKRRTTAFSLENSDAIEENERILEAGSQQRKENREAEKKSTSNQENVAHEPARTDTTPDTMATKSKKTSNGIVVNVPMDDYLQLTLMKCQTGRTLKDLALQAIHEFVEINK